MLIIIAALAENRVIGNKDRLPWDIPEEYEHFKNAVRGNVIIMGRNAYKNFDEDLGDTPIIVVSTTITELNRSQAVALPSIEDALQRARSYNREKIFIGGGASIYEQMMPLADEMWLSFVKGTPEGDRYFPEFDKSEWEVVKQEQHPDFEFRVYQRVKAQAS